jgi:large repetitive protein
VKKICRVYAALAAAMLLIYANGAVARAQPYSFTGYDIQSENTRELCAGVHLTEYKLKGVSGDSKEKRQHLFVLEMDPRENAKLTLAIGMKNGYVRGLMTTPGAAEYMIPSAGMIAAGINGDFFDMTSGGPLGYSMADGRWITSGEFAGGWALGVTGTGAARIGQPGFSLSLTASRAGVPVLAGTVINALNCLRGDILPARSTPLNAYEARLDNALVLYTRDYYTSTMAADGGYEVLLSSPGEVRSGQAVKGTVIDIHDERADTRAGTLKVPQGMPLKQGMMALSGIGAGADALRTLAIGDTVTITCDVFSGWADIVTCLGGGRPDGGPLLVEKGEICPENANVGDYTYFYSANPRTIAGIRGDGTYFLLVAEGYQTALAAGMTIAEISLMAKDLGAETALNLDGGPSSVMVVSEGKKLKVVSDAVGSGHVTAVGNSVYVIIQDK